VDVISRDGNFFHLIQYCFSIFVANLHMAQLNPWRHMGRLPDGGQILPAVPIFLIFDMCDLFPPAIE
jgi:hypothetical protein